MNSSDLSAMRQLVRNNGFSTTVHATDQMLARDISYDEVKDVLTSTTNQIVECQSPSQTIGQSHTDERVLIFDPYYPKDIIVIIVILFRPLPEVRVVTVEHVDYTIWNRISGTPPFLVRK